MNSERDKFLTEMMGECWHEFDENLKYNGVIWPCKNCGDEYLTNEKYNANENDFSTPDGFFKLWNWSQKQDWWKYFIGCVTRTETADEMCCPKCIIHLDRFADNVYEYLKERKC